MPSAKDVKFAIFPLNFCVFSRFALEQKTKICTRAKRQRFTKKKKLFFQRMVNESKKQKKTSEHVIQVMKSS